jgi:hypothetical protein
MRPFRIEFHEMELRVIVTALFTYAELMQALTEKEREAALVSVSPSPPIRRRAFLVDCGDEGNPRNSGAEVRILERL